MALLDPPTGMKLELFAESEDISAELLRMMTNLPVEYGFPPVSFQPLVESTGRGDYPSTVFNTRMHHVARLKLVATPNDNPVHYTYPCDTDGDGVDDARCESIFSSGTFVLEGTGVASAAFSSIYALRHFYQWLPPGPNQNVQAGDVNVGILNVTAGGSISVETVRRTLKQPGFKMARNDIVYEIKTTAVYAGPINLKIGGTCAFNYTTRQSTNPLILHCSADGAVCSPVDTQYEDCTALATVNTLSPFAVMIPLDDVTAPQTELSMIGDTAVVDGRVWITTDTYMDMTAGDRATVGDISGVATSYYLLDAAPTQECLTTPHDPQVPHGTCANPAYDGAFTLNEGSRTINYLSVDNWGNFEQPKTKNVFVDGTSPTTALVAKETEFHDGETAYITDADSVTIAAVDQVSGGVASGLKDRFFIINKSFEDCPPDPDFNGRPGTCRNPRYTEPFSLPIGTYTVYYSAIDNVGNKAEAKTAYLTVTSADTIPPVTDLSVVGNSAIVGDKLYINAASKVSLSAYDPAPVDSVGLVAYWNFDETEGAIAYDAVGTNNATLVNGPVLNSAGKVGTALQFDGIDDYVNAGNNLDLSAGAVTLAGWIYPTDLYGTGLAADKTIMSAFDSNGNRGYILLIRNGVFVSAPTALKDWAV